jgi:hypothetical protein
MRVHGRHAPVLRSGCLFGALDFYRADRINEFSHGETIMIAGRTSSRQVPGVRSNKCAIIPFVGFVRRSFDHSMSLPLQRHWSGVWSQQWSGETTCLTKGPVNQSGRAQGLPFGRPEAWNSILNLRWRLNGSIANSRRL